MQLFVKTGVARFKIEVNARFVRGKEGVARLAKIETVNSDPRQVHDGSDRFSKSRVTGERIKMKTKMLIYK